ncbi:hypothetical protein QOZ80_5AG0376630 [Eleusine coracana subsp. coracana]|nr:hypothetical protein QOZ80_5AG0376630 [Eleusine coracana subsp. coracana]
MASAVQRRREEHSRRSRSPARDRERRRSPPARTKDSPARARSPAKTSESHRDRERSPPREKVKEHVRSPKHAREKSRSRSPARRRDSRSPSPRTKRLRRAQAERETAHVSDGDHRKPSHREGRDTGKHREHDEGRDASKERKSEREVADGDRRKSSHREERGSGRHMGHDAGRDSSRDSKSGREDARGTVKDKKLDRDDGRDHSMDRRGSRDDKSSASREALSGRDDDRHDSRGGRSDREDRKSASSREQRLDRSDGKDSTRERLAGRDEKNGGSVRSSRRGRSVSPDPEEHRHRGRHESYSSPRTSRSAARIEDVNSRGNEVPGSEDADSVAKMTAAAEALEAKEKQKPSFELSGKLAEETNRVAGVNMLYSEPPEGRKPDIRWRLYVFKGGEPLNDPLYVHRLSCYLFGRERKVADVPTDHPSCSKQHAVLQYRLVEKEQPDGMMSKKVRPYLMDLDSTNGTYINENRIEPRRYYELFEKDTIKFGNSSRDACPPHGSSVNQACALLLLGAAAVAGLSARCGARVPLRHPRAAVVRAPSSEQQPWRDPVLACLYVVRERLRGAGPPLHSSGEMELLWSLLKFLGDIEEFYRCIGEDLQ